MLSFPLSWSQGCTKRRKHFRSWNQLSQKLPPLLTQAATTKQVRLLQRRAKSCLSLLQKPNLGATGGPWSKECLVGSWSQVFAACSATASQRKRSLFQISLWPSALLPPHRTVLSLKGPQRSLKFSARDLSMAAVKLLSQAQPKPQLAMSRLCQWQMSLLSLCLTWWTIFLLQRSWMKTTHISVISVTLSSGQRRLWK